MGMIACPKCGERTREPGFPAWAIIVAILLFPLGLLALLVDRKPAACARCLSG